MFKPVSYTHLDVYKRQRLHCVCVCVYLYLSDTFEDCLETVTFFYVLTWPHKPQSVFGLAKRPPAERFIPPQYYSLSVSRLPDP